MMDGPWRDNPRAGPSRRTVTVKHRGLVAELSVPILGVHQIDDPLGEEGRHILIIAGGPDKNLGVAGPAKALVTLWTIGRHFQIIGTLPPKDIAMQLVQHRIGTLEGGRDGRIRMHHNASDCIRGRCSP